MKKVISFVILVCLTVCFAACTAESVALDKSPKQVADAVIAAFPEYAELVYDYSGENEAEEVLMFMYGVYDEDCLAAVSDFVISERLGMTALTLAVVKFKDGTSAEIIDRTADLIVSEYVDSLSSALAMYSPDESALAKQYTLKKYDNALVLVIHGEDNDDVFAVID